MILRAGRPTQGTGRRSTVRSALAGALALLLLFSLDVFAAPGDPGPDVLKLWMVTPGVVVQRIIIDTGSVRPSYLAPPSIEPL